MAMIIGAWQSNGHNIERALQPFSLLHRRSWYELVQLDGRVSPRTKAATRLQRLVSESLQLLREGLVGPQGLVAEADRTGLDPLVGILFQEDFYTQLLGMMELNNTAIEIASPLQQLLERLPNLPEPERSLSWNWLRPVVSEIILRKERELDGHDEDETDASQEHDDDDDDDDDDCDHDEAVIAVEEEDQDTCMDVTEVQLDSTAENGSSTDKDPVFLQALAAEHIFPPLEGLGIYQLESLMNVRGQ